MPAPARLLAPGATVATAALLLAGCSGGSSGSTGSAAAPPASAAAATSATGCGSPPATQVDWPQAVPDTLPKPPGASITGTNTIGSATYVNFTSPVSLREGTLFVVTELRRAGFTLARGDAEPTEADAPFSGPTVVGALRLTKTAPCLTTWVLAVVPRNGPPPPLPSLVPYTGAPASPAGPVSTLIPYTPGPSASPLPFG